MPDDAVVVRLADFDRHEDVKRHAAAQDWERLRTRDQQDHASRGAYRRGYLDALRAVEPMIHPSRFAKYAEVYDWAQVQLKRWAGRGDNPYDTPKPPK